MSTIAIVKRKILKMYYQRVNYWKSPFTKVEIPSSMDEHIQYAYHLKSKQKSSLIVSLHSWAADYTQVDHELSSYAEKLGWNYIHPNFRGKNDHPQAVGSPLSMSDINDAIQYAIDHGNVDVNNIFIVGSSGGAYAGLCFYSASKYPINSYIVWNPITDLVAWHDQSVIRKTRYWKDIRMATNSVDFLNVEEAKKRSPLYRNFPDSDSKLYIFAGYHDGYGNAPVPVTHSIHYFNKYASLYNPDMIIPPEDIVRLASREHLMSDEMICDRKVVYTKHCKNAQITIFDGGHDHLVDHTVRIIRENMR